MPRFTKDPLLPENRILAALSRQEQERLLPHLEQVRLQTGQQFYESGEPIRYAYFPESALIALLSVTEDGATVEVGLVGNEGMLGIPILLEVRDHAIPDYRAKPREYTKNEGQFSSKGI